MATRLWGSRAAKPLKLSVFQRSFSSVLKHVNTREELKLDGNSGVKATNNTRVSGKFDESQINEEMKKLLNGLKPEKEADRHKGSNIYLIDEDEVDDDDEEENGNDERWIDQKCIGNVYGKRKLVGCVRYKIDTEDLTIYEICSCK